MRYLLILVLLSTLALQATSLPDDEADVGSPTSEAVASSLDNSAPLAATQSTDVAVASDQKASTQVDAPLPAEGKAQEIKTDDTGAGDSAEASVKDKESATTDTAAPTTDAAAPTTGTAAPTTSTAASTTSTAAPTPEVKPIQTTPPSSGSSYPELPPKKFNDSTKPSNGTAAGGPANSSYGNGARSASNGSYGAASNASYGNPSTSNATNATNGTNTTNGTYGATNATAKTNLSNALDDAKNRIVQAANILTSDGEQKMKTPSWIIAPVTVAALLRFH